MQRWLLATSLAIIAASAGAQTSAAPESQKFAHVSGVVIDEQDGRLLRRVMVCLQRDSNNAHCDETDTQGRFNIINLRPARYGYRLERKDIFRPNLPPTACRP